jgi:uncharacterized protein YkwD
VRRAVAAVVAVLLLAGMVVLWRDGELDALTVDEMLVASWSNGERRWNGLEPLLIDGDLHAQAAQQSDRMARCSCMFHSPSGELGWWLTRGWHQIGENVGATSGQGVFALFGVHLAWVASPGHRANMLGDYRGIGVAIRQSDDGRLWLTQVYGGY